MKLYSLDMIVALGPEPQFDSVNETLLAIRESVGTTLLGVTKICVEAADGLTQ